MTSRLWFSLLMLGWAATATGAPRFYTLGHNVQLACTQPLPDSLACEYRLVNPGEVRSIRAAVGTKMLPPPDFSPHPGASRSGAILFLVDTSDPARQSAIDLVRGHIQSLMSVAGEQHPLALARFDTDLEMLVPFGSPREDVAKAAAELKAIGRTTELYRNTLQAVRHLAAIDTARRALVLFSDGLAEDQAYFHRDVVDAANASGVMIFGLGYARSASQSVALQTVRRLAEETGGTYLSAGDNPELPPSFSTAMFESLENGGGFTLDLIPAIEEGLGGDQSVSVVLELASGEASAAIPVRLPQATVVSAQPIVIEKPVIVEKTVEIVRPPAPALAPLPTHPPAAPSQLPGAGATPWLWYLMGALALMILGVLVIVALLLRRSKQTPRPATTPSTPVETLGYLELQDGTDTRHPITSAAFRIGRHSSNDLTIDDPSVSRQHAEIHRRRDGTFTVTDLDSMNGIFVNDQQKKHAELKEGDLLELGDVSMRFRVRPSHELSGEQTVMLKTIAPSANVTRDDEEMIA